MRRPSTINEKDLWDPTIPQGRTSLLCCSSLLTFLFSLIQTTVFVGVLSTFFFTLLVYLASFLATYFIPADSLSDDYDAPSSMRFSFFYGYWVNPFDLVKDLIRVIYRVLQEEDVILPSTSSSRLRSTAPLRYPKPTPPGPLGQFFRRLILGLPVVGAASLVQMLWSLSMLAPFHWITRWRALGANNRDRRSRSRDVATLLIVIAIIGGAIRYVVIRLYFFTHFPSYPSV